MRDGTVDRHKRRVKEPCWPDKSSGMRDGGLKYGALIWCGQHRFRRPQHPTGLLHQQGDSRPAASCHLHWVPSWQTLHRLAGS